MAGLIEELSWRGLLHTIYPETEAQLSKEMTVGYVGFDPTADSLHIGSLVPILLLYHLQQFGHRPIALVGGATGMIGDPSGKSNERNLLDEVQLNKNVEGIKNQLSKFLDFSTDKPNSAILVNNYDWMKSFSFIDFSRDIGKHLTVNYMMAKDSVKNRISGESAEGMSFTEFTYQLLQGYDFFYLYEKYNCKLQMGGSDQWGNITTGTELIRRKVGGEAFAITCPLTTKSDGSKFGKSESGENIWLDLNRTSAFKFYQFWVNVSDADAEKFIKIYTFLSQNETEQLILTHQENPGLRLLQQRLAKEITTWVHGESELQKALNATEVLFGKSDFDALTSLSVEIFNGVPQQIIDEKALESGLPILDLLAETTQFLSSKSEAKRALKENSIALNRKKVTEDYLVTNNDFINGQYLFLQRGKKSYFVVILNP